MARTVQEIYDALITEKETFASLNGLTPSPDDSQTLLTNLASTSLVAVWRLLLWVVATGIATHEQLFDAFKIEIEEIANGKESGVPTWYRDQSLLYQEGDALVWNGKQYVYAVPDATKQIVKRCAVIDGGIVFIKVATLDAAGNVVQLTPSQEAGVKAYWAKKRFAGVAISVSSNPADDLKLDYKIVYDPLILAADGSLIDDPAVFPVEDAINAYVGNLSTQENFGGVLNITALTDVIQGAEGVIDPIFNSAEARPSGGTFAAFTENYTPSAGYCAIDPGFPLNSTLTYVAG